MKLYSVSHQLKEVMAFVSKWMELENVPLSESKYPAKTQKVKGWIFSVILRR